MARISKYYYNIEFPTIYIPGTYDMWNVGHIRLFKYARKLFPNAYVIAGVSSDKLVKSYKYIKPINPLKERMETVLSCKYVEHVIVQNTFFNIKQLKKYRIDFVFLGSDWKGVNFPALEKAQRQLCFQVIYKPYTKEVSSSIIKKRIIKNAYAIMEAKNKRK